MSERCEECNYKRGHAPHCRHRTSADLMRELHLPGHEAEQHRAAYGNGDVCGPAAPYFGSREEQLDASTRCTCGVGVLIPAGRLHSPECALGKAAWDADEEPPTDVDECFAEPATTDLGLNPKDLIGATKTPLGLLPWSALVQVAPVFALGARKYGAYNWRTPGQPVQHVTYVEAAFRHLAAYMDGQTLDPESGVNHLAHAVAGLLILLDASAVGNAVDNRPTPGAAAEIMGVYGKAA